MKRVQFLLALLAFCAFALQGVADPSAPRVSLIEDPGAGAPIRHGVEKLTAALRAKGVHYEEVGSLQAAHGQVFIVAGLPTPPATPPRA